MKQIMCIDDSTTTKMRHPFLEYGEVYETIGTYKNINGEECYLIPGFPDSHNPHTGRSNNGPLYRKIRFILLSDIDETELAEQRTSTVPIYGF